MYVGKEWERKSTYNILTTGLRGREGGKVGPRGGRVVRSFRDLIERSKIPYWSVRLRDVSVAGSASLSLSCPLSSSRPPSAQLSSVIPRQGIIIIIITIHG